MEKKSVIIGIIAILVTVGLSGCNSSEQTTGQTSEELFIGNWYTEIEDIGMNFRFYENFSVCATVQGMSVWAEYEITEDQIIFTNSDGTITSNEYAFTNNNQKLTINDPNGEVMILTRQ